MVDGVSFIGYASIYIFFFSSFRSTETCRTVNQIERRKKCMQRTYVFTSVPPFLALTSKRRNSMKSIFIFFLLQCYPLPRHVYDNLLWYTTAISIKILSIGSFLTQPHASWSRSPPGTCISICINLLLRFGFFFVFHCRLVGDCSIAAMRMI